MLAVLVFMAALVGTVAAASECGKTWNYGVSVAVILVSLVLCFVVPYGVYVAAVGSVMLFQRARTRRFMMLASDDLDDEDKILEVFE